jgi:two-component system, OmpR family, response regulator CpxR
VSHPQSAFLSAPTGPSSDSPITAAPIQHGSIPVTLPIELAVLLVDDDHELCGLMRDFFKPHRVGLDVEHDGRRGLARALEQRHDLVLLDCMLPGLDGFEVLREVRQRSRIPIIMLTARADASDRVAGLEAGADDYLSKPFGPEELLARIRAVLRRSGRVTLPRQSVIAVNGVRLDAAARSAWCDGESLTLTSTEFDILERLMRAAGRIVSRRDLTNVACQRDLSPFDRSLDVHISHLRTKLERRRSLIKTVRGVGYLFRAEPEQAIDAAVTTHLSQALTRGSSFAPQS